MDGDLGLVAAGHSLLRNDGSGTITDDSAGNMPAVGGNGRVHVLGDVDGNADLDLLGNDHGFSPFGSPARVPAPQAGELILMRRKLRSAG